MRTACNLKMKNPVAGQLALDFSERVGTKADRSAVTMRLRLIEEGKLLVPRKSGGGLPPFLQPFVADRRAAAPEAGDAATFGADPATRRSAAIRRLAERRVAARQNLVDEVVILAGVFVFFFVAVQASLRLI